MTDTADRIRSRQLDVALVRPASDPLRPLTRDLVRKAGALTRGIGFKFSLLIITLVTLTALGISLAVVGIMDDVLLQSMVQRGAAITSAAASPAGYNILAEDRLALDNLVAQISSSQTDLDYIAIVDNHDRILAHNRLELSGEPFPRLAGTPIGNSRGIDVRKVRVDGKWLYEFSVPIVFSGSTIGRVSAGLNATRLDAARQQARAKILMIVVLLLPLAIAGAFLLARLFTYPVEQLALGVSRLRAGEDNVTVPITSDDELADLTRSFNDMARRMMAQRQSLVNYSDELERSYADIVKILAAALDARDNYTYGHSARVALLSVNVGRSLGLKPYELKDLEMACMLHDIGKIRIADAILNKHENLSGQEYRNIMNHPKHGTSILELADSLKKFIPAVRHHHEWYDGSGYPSGLAGDDIPLYARIISIADAYDAMTSSRPYRDGLSRAEAINELFRFRGIQFDPELTDVFIDSLQEYGDVCDMPLYGGAP